MIELRPFDPDSATRAEWVALHAFRRARNEEDAPGDPLLDDAEFERQARHRWPLYEDRRWFAWAEDGIVGSGGASFRREGTADYEAHAPHLYAWGGVREHRRRGGIGTGLLGPLLVLMRERNKTLATFNTSSPDGDAFLVALGATLKHRQVENRAPFAALDWDLLERWSAAAPEHGALRWEIHEVRVPRDRMDALVPQFDTLSADVPQGELEGPRNATELPAWLAWYDELDRYGGEHALVMLIDGDAVAAVCETAWDARFPDRVYQLLTAVARPWRGRGLAKRVKAAMLRLIRERHPDIRFLSTSNASVNAPMLSINRRLGFVEHRPSAVYQIGVDALADALACRLRSELS